MAGFDRAWWSLILFLFDSEISDLNLGNKRLLHLLDR